jgi:ribulose-phosphate 3-epimerase
MPDTCYLAPSILSADFSRLGESIRQVEEAGADWIHVDVMDGHFVPNITLGPLIVRAVRQSTALPLDVHLMIENPERYLVDFAEAGADHLTVQWEACTHIHRVIQEIHHLGCKAGVAVNPGTPTEFLREILPDLDLVLVMTVNPGFAGQEFIRQSPEKIARARILVEEVNNAAIIEVDGGITAKTLPIAFEAGARAFVAGSSVYGHPQGAQAGLRVLRESLHQHV